MSKKNPFEGIDHSDKTEDEKQAKGIETETEKEARVAKQEEEKKAKKSAKPKTKKAKAKPKKAAAKKGAKKATKKPAKKISKADAPLGLNKAGEPRQKAEFDPDTTMGQRGPKIKEDDFEPNDNESAVLSAVRRAGKIVLSDLAERAFPKNKKANSWTRNALRRLIRARVVKKVGRGEYEKVA